MPTTLSLHLQSIAYTSSSTADERRHHHYYFYVICGPTANKRCGHRHLNHALPMQIRTQIRVLVRSSSSLINAKWNAFEL